MLSNANMQVNNVSPSEITKKTRD